MNRLGRTLRYLNTMFPPRAMLPIGAAHFLSVYLALQALAGGGDAPLRVGWRAVAGAATTVLWMLLVRLQDDIADADADVRLGRAGDPRYRDRPIVKGEITVSELRATALGSLVLLLGINGSFGPSAMLAACIGGLVITWVGFRWFFIPALARDPSPIAYLVRKALTVLLSVYAVAVFLDDFPGARLSPWTTLLLIAPVAEVAAWETARKIRIPEDETEYGTYSKVLGWRTAAVLPIAFIAVALACLLLLARRIGVGWGFAAALTTTALLAIAATLRFRLAPTRARANLRPYAELFGAVAHAGLAVALGLRYGLAFA